MKIKLSDNIKRFRSEKKMTQEQLAEALGVSISAVHKWEANKSTPDLQLILEMADLFHTSTDVLIGYEWRNFGANVALERIVTLTKERKYEDAITESEKALKSYPNNFDIVYQSALLYMEIGIDLRQRKECKRAVELFEHACELIAQNQDDTVSEVSIRTQIAKVQLSLNNIESALKILKKYNVCGVNNAMIGMVLGDYLHDADSAEKYLGKAFVNMMDNLNSIMVGYANVFFQRKNFDAVIECFQWLRIVLRGTHPRSKLTWFDKYDCVLLEMIAECYCFKGEFETAYNYLKDAVSRAVQYDSVAPEEVEAMAFLSTLNAEQSTYDLYGKSALECLARRIVADDDVIPQLWKLWNKVKEEELSNEPI